MGVMSALGRRNGAQILVDCLQANGLDLAFGIPGTHNTEIYDAMERAGIRTVLVADERSAAFMADGAARALGRPTVLNLVPGAGLTHALSGIAEAFMDSVPMIVIASGIRTDSGHAFQLHAIDQLAVARPVVKGAIAVATAAEIPEAVARSIALATGGEPGPVLIELPANVLLLGDADVPPTVSKPVATLDHAAADQAVALIRQSPRIGLYVGAGCRDAAKEVVELAHRLNAPVAWTLSGSGIYPADGAQAVWCGFGQSAPPFARDLFGECDLLIAVGCKFGEVATGSYGLTLPPKLIHVDANPAVFNRNYPADVAVAGDARVFLLHVLSALIGEGERSTLVPAPATRRQQWLDRDCPGASDDDVSPARFFRSLRARLPRNAMLTVDSGNHTFLAMEHFPFYEPGTFFGPFDFSCMGYSVPAAIGAKLAEPERMVAAVVGDGSFLMTGCEVVTAVREGLGIPFFVFCDGALGQISQFQKTQFNRSTATDLSEVRLRGFAQATGADYVEIARDGDLGGALDRILSACQQGRPTIVAVRVNYDRLTSFTKGVVKANLSRLPAEDKIRIIARAALRHTIDRPVPATPRPVPVTRTGCGRVLIVGQGAIGATIGARLTAGGFAFTAIERREDLAATIASDGVRLDGFLGRHHERFPVLTAIPEGAVFETILLATKSYDTETALAVIRPHLAEDGVLVSLQNGVNEDRLIELLPQRQVIGGVIAWAALHHGDARITITSPTLKFYLGRVDGSIDPQLTAVRELLAHVVDTEVTTNLYGHLWAKLVVNCMVNPTCALFDRTFGELLADPAFLPVCIGIISEVVAVAEAQGVRLEKLKERIDFRWLADPIYLAELRRGAPFTGAGRLGRQIADVPAAVLRRALFALMARGHTQVKSSMWQDLHQGTPTEIDYINGYVAALGQKLGIDCHVNGTITRLMHEVERTGKRPARDEIYAALADRAASGR